MDRYLSSLKGKEDYLIIMFTLCMNILILKDDVDIKFDKVTEFVFLFMSVVFYNVNRRLTFGMVLTYLMIKYKNSNI